jgi:hypothetical protein
MTVKNICVYNMYPAILGIRNSFKSKGKSDSDVFPGGVITFGSVVGESSIVSFNHCQIGKNDGIMIRKLLSSKLAHQERKFLRQILVSMDIKGSIKFWAQMDTFKIATVRNSESTMHSIVKGKITQDDFEREINQSHLDVINSAIKEYNKLSDMKELEDLSGFKRKLFEQIDANLPSGYLLESHWTANYEVLRNIYHSRKDHKMYWWKEFCEYIEKLPYFELLIKD